MKDKKYRKVRDHCHHTGKYRAAPHSKWNLKYSVPKIFQQFFKMNQTMIIILSQKSWQKNLKNNLLV